MLLTSHGSLNSRAGLAGWICDVGTDYRQGGRTHQQKIHSVDAEIDNRIIEIRKK